MLKASDNLALLSNCPKVGYFTSFRIPFYNYLDFKFYLEQHYNKSKFVCKLIYEDYFKIFGYRVYIIVSKPGSGTFNETE